MAASLADLQAYAPTLSVPAPVATPLLARAARWAAKALAGVTNPDPLDVRDAECAYALYLLATSPDNSVASTAQSFKAGDLEVKLAAQKSAGEALSEQATDWLARAWQHLFDAGLPRPKYPAGATR